jgi:hypothetical protein
VGGAVWIQNFPPTHRYSGASLVSGWRRTSTSRSLWFHFLIEQSHRKNEYYLLTINPR